MIEIVFVERLTDQLYLTIFPYLKKGVTRLNDGASVADLVDEILTKRKQLWLVYENKKLLLVVITGIVEYPTVKRLLYYIVVGESFDRCIEQRQTIEDWARTLGCTEIEIFCRRGWEKKLKQFGYKLNYISMTNAL